MPNEYHDDREHDEDRPRRRNRDDGDFDRDRDEDRSRRRDHDDDRDPRRSHRREDDTSHHPKDVSVLGVFSLIQGIGSLFASFIPCVGALAIIGGAVGLLLGLTGYFIARKSERTGTGFPIAGSLVNLAAIVIGGAWLLLMAAIFQKGGGGIPEVDDGNVITITARALDEEYDDNELASDTKYKGKTLVVTGKIERITRDDKPGKITVELTGTPGSTVDCNFDRDKQGELGTLTVGQEVTIRGKCRGKIRTFVTLETCSLDKTPEKKPESKAGPAVAVTAETLEADYNGNVVSADEKYKGKLLEVTGKVFKVSRNQPGKITVDMESETGWPVTFDFNSKETQTPLGMVAVGDSVVIRGTCRGKDDGPVLLENCTLVKKLNESADGPSVVVKLDTLDKDYQKNVVAADTKYKGKRLEVTGSVLRVSRNKPGKITVELGTDDHVMLMCDFLTKDGQTQLGEISDGDTITIRGQCRGKTFGVPLMENCMVVKK